MRRVIVALLGAAFGTSALIGAKAHSVPSGSGAVADAALDPSATTAAVSGSGTTPGTAVGSAQPGASASPGASRTAGPSASARPGTSTSTTTAPPASKTYTGVGVAVPTAQSPTVKSSPCGDCANYAISVSIVVSGGRITSTSVSYSTSPGASQTYASTANNQLKASILTAQTWNLGRVSGATYAGNAWELSVKDAMTKAGLPV